MNLIILKGRLTKDVEMTMAQSSVPVSKFTLAVDRKFKKEGQSNVDFINCVAFQKTAEFIKKYFEKGQLILVNGSMQNRTWEKDGVKQYATDVIVADVEFCESKKQEQGQAEQTQDDGFMTVDPGQLPF
jgi:single-strand DNA-binding protein